MFLHVSMGFLFNLGITCDPEKYFIYVNICIIKAEKHVVRNGRRKLKIEVVMRNSRFSPIAFTLLPDR